MARLKKRQSALLLDLHQEVTFNPRYGVDMDASDVDVLVARGWACLSGRAPTVEITDAGDAKAAAMMRRATARGEARR